MVILHLKANIKGLAKNVVFFKSEQAKKQCNGFKPAHMFEVAMQMHSIKAKTSTAEAFTSAAYKTQSHSCFDYVVGDCFPSFMDSTCHFHLVV